MPSTFSPSTHTHSATDISSGTLSAARLPTISYTALSNVPTTFSPATHTHSATDISSGTLDAARLPTISYTALSNVPSSFTPATHTHSATDISSGTIATARLGSGTASSSTYLRGDQTWAAVSASVADGSVTTVKIADGIVYDCGVYPAVAPVAPSGVVGTAGSSQVALSWTAPTNNGGASITDYAIGYSTNSGTSYAAWTHSASTVTSATVTGLTNGTAYILRVAGVNSVGTGTYAVSSSITPVSAATFNTFNATWTAVGFSGSGTSGSPYTKASYATNIAGMQATIVSNGTLRVTGGMYSDFGWTIYKNGASAVTQADLGGGNGYTYTMSVTLTVNAGDVIRFGTAGTDNYSIPATALNIWWQ